MEKTNRFYSFNNESIILQMVLKNVTIQSNHGSPGPVAANSNMTFNCTADVNPSVNLELITSKGDKLVEEKVKTFVHTVDMKKKYNNVDIYCKADNTESHNLTYEVTCK